MRIGKRCHSMPGTPCPILQVDCTFIITVQAATCRNPLAQKQFLYAKSNLALHTFGGCFSILTCAQDCLDLHATGVTTRVGSVRLAYKRKGAKWKKLTDTVTYFIAKGSLPTFTYG